MASSTSIMWFAAFGQWRGVVTTAMWRAAIEKQKRHEFQEMELLIRTVSRLQPHFITPWIFQSWNIAYNVSVEQILLWNELPSPRIRVGQQLLVKPRT